MKKFLIKEYFPFQREYNKTDKLSITEQRYVDNGGVILTGILQRADAKNNNGRIYSRTILEREVKKYQNLVENSRSLGELDHPAERPEILLSEVSHMITKIWWEGNEMWGKLKLLNTPKGQIAKALVEDGVLLGISSRGLGSLTNEGSMSRVNDDFSLICWDLVAEPSTDNAFVQLREVKDYNINNLQEGNKSIYKDIKIQELMEDILWS